MPVDAHADAMSDTLTPHEAARVLGRAQSWEGALLDRTAGLTWMVWGLATPGIFLTYAFASVVSQLDGLAIPGWVWSILWLPWTAAGIVATSVLWRSAALAVPALDSPRERRRALVGGVGFGLLLFVAFLLLDPDGALIPLGAVGAMWTLMAITNVWGADREGRIVGVLTGLGLVVSAFALGLSGADQAVTGTWSIVLSGLLPFAAGTWHVWRA